MNTAVIRFIGVGRTYPGPPTVHALRQADLRIDRGDHVAIMGPSGSGKSTLLNLAGLLDRPSTGTYELDGLDVSTMSEAQRTAVRAHRIGFVFQAFHLMPYRTAVENVALAQLYRKVPRRQRFAAALGALSRVGLEHRAHALPGTLSGGEQQRVAVARALVNRPSLLLCDEPTGNLDSATATGILELLDDLHGSGFTIVVITHDPNVAARAQRTINLRDGHVLNQGW